MWLYIVRISVGRWRMKMIRDDIKHRQRQQEDCDQCWKSVRFVFWWSYSSSFSTVLRHCIFSAAIAGYYYYSQFCSQHSLTDLRLSSSRMEWEHLTECIILPTRLDQASRLCRMDILVVEYTKVTQEVKNLSVQIEIRDIIKMWFRSGTDYFKFSKKSPSNFDLWPIRCSPALSYFKE